MRLGSEPFIFRAVEFNGYNNFCVLLISFVCDSLVYQLYIRHNTQNPLPLRCGNRCIKLISMRDNVWPIRSHITMKLMSATVTSCLSLWKNLQKDLKDGNSVQVGSTFYNISFRGLCLVYLKQTS